MTMTASTRTAARPKHNGTLETNGTACEPAAHETRYRQDAASYVAAMLAELRRIASKAGFDKLVKSLDAAYYEAYGALDAGARDASPAPGSASANGAGGKISESVEPNHG
jgi:hypothetical protein